MSHNSAQNSTWAEIKVLESQSGTEYAYVAMAVTYDINNTVCYGITGDLIFIHNQHWDFNQPQHDFLSQFNTLSDTIEIGDYIRINTYVNGPQPCYVIIDKLDESEWNNGDGTIVAPEAFSNIHGSWVAGQTLTYHDINAWGITGHFAAFAEKHNASTSTINTPCLDCIGPLPVTPTYGCTDPLASNYDPSATVDDGSCTYPTPGCTDPLALNYNAAADTDDGSCVYPRLGCTDPLALNYDPLATTDDGSCVYCEYGCTNPLASNFDPNATCDNGSCIPCVYGCTNPGSSNYNPLATCDDGSCIGCVYGCNNPTASNYNSSATCDDGSCCIDGCTDPTALNYNALATCDDGSCEHCIDGCTDPNAGNYNASATCDDGSCLESECSDCFRLLNVLYKEANCEGCNEDDYLTEKSNLQRFNNLRIMRDIAYECGDNDYIEVMQAEEYEMCSELLDEHTNEGVNDYKVYGCTNPTSANYNPAATHPCTRKGVVNFCCGNSSTLKTSGCTDPLATNYNPSANIDDGSCTYLVQIS